MSETRKLRTIEKKRRNAEVSGGESSSLDRYRSLLNERGLRATPQRLALLSALLRAGTPLSIEGLRARVGTNIDLSTLYRSMHSLTKKGIVRSVDVRHGHAHYEIALGAVHHHVVCTSCGTTEAFVWKGCKLLERTALAQTQRFATINDHALELFGQCKRCVTR